MDGYDIWFAPVTLVIVGVMVLALLDAVRMRRWRWAATIVVLPVIGAMAWWTAGRRAYRLNEQGEER